MTTCPHCRRECPEFVLDKHAAACPENPTVRAAIAAALPDPDRPGHARTYAQYNAIRVLHGAPYSDVLSGHYGTWRKACAAFGLLPGRAAPIKANICPHCGIAVKSRNPSFHIDRCVSRPGVRDLVRRIMDVDGTGVGMSTREYNEEAKAYNAAIGDGERAPAIGLLADQIGDWEAVLAWAGLRKPPQGRPRLEREAAAIADVADALCMNRAALEAERLGGYGLQVSRVREVVRGGRVEQVCELR